MKIENIEAIEDIKVGDLVIVINGKARLMKPIYADFPVPREKPTVPDKLKDIFDMKAFKRNPDLALLIPICMKIDEIIDYLKAREGR